MLARLHRREAQPPICIVMHVVSPSPLPRHMGRSFARVFEHLSITAFPLAEPATADKQWVGQNADVDKTLPSLLLRSYLLQGGPSMFSSSNSVGCQSADVPPFHFACNSWPAVNDGHTYNDKIGRGDAGKAALEFYKQHHPAAGTVEQ